MGVNVRKIVVQTKADQVYQYLREAIVSGEFGPGEKLVLSEIAQMYGVSEIPVREACKRLEAEKLIVIKPYEGITVSELDPEAVRETLEVRAILEREAARMTVPRIGEETLSLADSLLERMRTAVKEDDWDSFSKANKQFHIILLDACPNRRLAGLAAEIWDSLGRARHGFRWMPEEQISYFQLNEQICQALRARDGERVGELLYRQAIQYGEKLVEYLRSQPRKLHAKQR